MDLTTSSITRFAITPVGSSACRRHLALGASVLAITLGAAGMSHGASLTEMDYFTETTGNAAMEKILAACTAETGIKVERQAVPYPQLVEKVLLAATSNSLPDLIMMDNSDVAQLAEGGMIVPLADVGVSTEGFTPSLVAIGNYKGKNYSLQTAVNTLALWYNVDILRAAGVEPPKTWDELRATAKKLTKGQVYGFVFPAVATEEGTFHASPFVWSNGGDFTKLNSPQAVEAVTFLADLVNDGSVSKSVVTWAGDDANEQFVAGRAAMSIGGSWHIPENSKVANLHYAIVPLPVPHAGDQIKVPVGGEVWSVSASADKATAKRMLDCLGSDKMVLQWAEDRNYVPGKPAVLDQYKKDNPGMAPFVSSTAGAVSRTSVLGTKYPKYSAAFSAAEQAVIIGSKTAQAALDEAQQTAAAGQ
ncbi:MAG: sugar ABC transporter substrate-binding protein [Methylobacteriaceae bacterium]|nr:sugar ABC transporter substrate-binding protein [Methylobacteriaceae bacterium]